jgi:uncharacterized spore protein YtfJ
MTDEEKPVVEEIAAEPVPAEALSSLDVLQSTFDQFLATANVNAVYAKPVRQGDTVVITAAEVFSGFGFGLGEGSGQQGEQKGGGSGGGGGGQTFSRPVAVVVCTPNGVSIQPVMDRTKLWMAALTAAGFMLVTLSKMRRPPRGR